MANYAHTKSRIWQWTGIILILCLFGGAYWYFKVYGSTLNQSQNDLNTNGLVGLWSFNGDDISGTTAYDRSSSGNNGTLTNGPSKTDGKIGQALDFFPNGSDTNAYVTMGDPGSGVLDFGTGDFSVSFWFKGRGFVSQGSSLNGMIMKRAVDSVNAAGWVFYTDSNNGVGLNVNGGSDSSSIYITGGTGKATDNTWHHVVGVRSGTAISLYLDRNRIAIGTLSGSVSNAVALTFGDDNLGSRNFNGTIDEVRMYNRAFATTDIESLYTQGGGTKVNTAVSQPQGTGRLDSGLAGYWKLDETTGSSATDTSVNSGTGTLYNTENSDWEAGQIGNGLTLDGVNEYVQVANATPLQFANASSITLSAWIKPAQNTTYATIFSKGRDSSDVDANYALRQNTTGKKLEFYYNESGNTNWHIWTTTNDIFSTTGIWYHVMVTYTFGTGSSIKAYVNGVERTGSWTGGSGNVGPDVSTQVLFIGKISASERFSGTLDEIRIYNRALPLDEASQLYRLTTPTGVDTSLKGYWSFNAPDMASTTAYDRSGAGNTGTLTNGPAITEGKLGQALSFDGSNDYITVKTSSLISASSALTVSAWVKTSLTADNQNIYTENNATNGYLVHQVSILNTGKVVYDTYAPSGGGLNSATSVNDGVWHHITVTRAVDDTTSIYIDGTLDISGSVADYDAGFSVDNVSIGRRHNTVTPSQDDYFSGLMDEVRIYNRALSAGEVKGLYDVGQSDKVNSSASQPQGTGRLDSGLAGYWKLDDGSGTSATDSSTNANTGTMTNMESGDWTTGQIGSAGVFDGVNERVSVPDSNALDITQTITVSAWVKGLTNWTGTTEANFILCKCGYSTFEERNYQLYVSTAGKLRFGFDRNGVGGGVNSNATLSIGQWYFVTATYDQKNISLYINGTLDTVAAETDAMVANTYTLAIGSARENTGNYGHWEGNIDETRIYNRALSSDEVAELYRLNSPTGTDTGLKGYWSFNGQDLSGTTAYDRSGAGNNGTLTNGPVITEGKIGQALNFDGADDYVSVSDSASLSPSAAMTVSFWSKITGTFASERPLIGKDASGQRSWRILSTTSAGIKLCVAADANDSCGQFGTSNNNVLTQNKWSYISVVFDGAGSGNAGRAKVYVDGVLISMTYTGTIPASLVDVAAALTFGAYSTDRLPGVFDEVRIYNRALSATEIASLYNASR